jgi:hypothetical protein
VYDVAVASLATASTVMRRETSMQSKGFDFDSRIMGQSKAKGVECLIEDTNFERRIYQMTLLTW